MAEFLTAPFTGEQVAKRILFLAYQASQVVGMGHFQKKDGVSEQEVWEQCYDARDYGGFGPKGKPGRLSADYVFGRMMKLGITWTEGSVCVPGERVSPDYQSWCTVYRTADDLIAAALLDLKNDRPTA